MFSFRYCIVVTVTCGILLSAAAASPVEFRPDIAYGPSPDEMLDLCLPAGGARNGPAVVLIHGGGWISGNRKSGGGWFCRKAAEAGIVGAEIDYRLAVTPEGKWPAALQDAQLAIRWMRAHARELGFDPRRLCASGASAGAQLAVFLAVLKHTAPGDRSALLGDISSSVSCAVDVSGPIDLTGHKPLAHALPNLAQSQDPDALAAVASAASPLLLVTPETSPIMIFQGDQDPLVPPDQGLALRDALAAKGVKFVYRAYEGGHGLTKLPRDLQIKFKQEQLDFILSSPPGSG